MSNPNDDVYEFFKNDPEFGMITAMYFNGVTFAELKDYTLDGYIQEIGVPEDVPIMKRFGEAHPDCFKEPVAPGQD